MTDHTPTPTRVLLPDGPVLTVDGGYVDESDDLHTVTGRRVDQALVDEVVADVHEQLAADPGRFSGRSGRPSLSGRVGAHSPQVAFRVPQELVAELDELTTRAGVSRSALAREALAEYVAAHRP